jgi:hypothetical protein
MIAGSAISTRASSRSLRWPPDKLASGLASESGERYEIEQRHRLFVRVSFFTGHAARPQPVRKDLFAELAPPAEHYVFDYSHIGKRTRNLERASEPHVDAPMMRGRFRGLAVDEDSPRIGALATRQQVKHRGLAGAIRSDQSGNLAAPDEQGNAVDRGHAAKSLNDIFRDERRRARARDAGLIRSSLICCC